MNNQIVDQSSMASFRKNSFLQINWAVSFKFQNEYHVYQDKNNFHQEQIKGQLMNILTIPQMTLAEQHLLSIQLDPTYTVQPLDSSMLEQLTSFSSSFFPSANPKLLGHLHKIVKNYQNVIQVNTQQVNSSLKMFTYMTFSILFPLSQDPINKMHKSLVQALKCSLYSKDIDFHNIQSANIKVDNIQAKAAVARFLNHIINSQYSNLIKIKYAKFLLQKHPLLFKLFLLFFRLILTKLQIQGARQFNYPLGFYEALTNLISFFDIDCKNNNQFLLLEGKYFLAVVEQSLIAGQIKDQEQSLQKFQSYKSVRSCRQKNGKKVNKKQSPNILKDYQNQSIQQMESIQMDSSSEQSEDSFLKNKNSNDNISNQKSLLKKSIFRPQNSGYLDQQLAQCLIDNLEQNKKAIVDQKNFFSFSPSIAKNGFFGPFTSFANDIAFIGSGQKINVTEPSQRQLLDINIPLTSLCKCCQIKKIKNKIITNVIEFTITPALNKIKNGNPYYNNRPSIKSSLPKPQRENKIPSFIKLRKDKNNINRSSSPKQKEKSKSKNSFKDNIYLLGQSTIKQINNRYTQLSYISTKDINQNKCRYSRTTARKNQSYSLSNKLIRQTKPIKIDNLNKNNYPKLVKNNGRSSSNLCEPQSYNSNKLLTKQFVKRVKNEISGYGEAPNYNTAPVAFSNPNIENSSKILLNTNRCLDSQISERHKIRKIQSINYYQRQKPI